MKHTSLALLATFALSLAACADFQNPVTPRARTLDRVAASSAQATVGSSTMVIYSNFGPGMTFDSNPLHGWTINGFVCPFCGQQAISQQFFTPPGDYAFARATVALSHFSGPARIRVVLQADSLGRPGHVVEEVSIDSIGTAPAIYTVSSMLSPVLRDTLYWLTVAAGGSGVLAGWMWNSIGDASSTTFASTQGGGPSGPWAIGLNQTRSAFQIEGRLLPTHGAFVHQASGGGTVLYAGAKVTYGITALEMADGTVKGELLFHWHDNGVQFKGTVTCLIVVGNRAFISGDLTQTTPPFDAPRFAIGLQDNGEGNTATAPDWISGLTLLSENSPRCYRVTPWADWTHGNAQVK